MACFASALALACTLVAPARGAIGQHGWSGAEETIALHQVGRTDGAVGRLADHRRPASTAHGLAVALVPPSLVVCARTPWIRFALERDDRGLRLFTSKAHRSRGPPERSS